MYKCMRFCTMKFSILKVQSLGFLDISFIGFLHKTFKRKHKMKLILLK